MLWRFFIGDGSRSTRSFQEDVATHLKANRPRARFKALHAVRRRARFQDRGAGNSKRWDETNFEPEDEHEHEKSITSPVVAYTKRPDLSEQNLQPVAAYKYRSTLAHTRSTDRSHC